MIPAGVYIFHFAGGGDKNMVCWLGKKFDGLFKKKRKYKGEEVEKGIKFPLYLGEKILFWIKGGRGKNIIFRANIHPGFLCLGLDRDVHQHQALWLEETG